MRHGHKVIRQCCMANGGKVSPPALAPSLDARSANLATSRNDSREAFAINDLILWNELTRREQRIMNKLFGGGSAYGDGPIETVNLMRLDLITESGLTSAGLELFITAFKAQRDVCRAN
ncbi:hypothetical protein [Tardiphaga sp. 841_E9_N1_2]|jgi:hypothetical protein|uniref:hypothetical protein n=1 Tax=Tardiphaga sp. 841_E9_N1_2 TaxID=3240762 RepID=UPI003F250BAC